MWDSLLETTNERYVNEADDAHAEGDIALHVPVILVSLMTPSAMRAEQARFSRVVARESVDLERWSPLPDGVPGDASVPGLREHVESEAEAAPSESY